MAEAWCERDSSKRTSHIDWDEYFMAIACLSAKRSKDPKTQVGACIVNDDKRIVSIGYNGMPMGCKEFPWHNGKRKSLNTKHLYVCHAVLNAVLNKYSNDVKNCTIYVVLFPCNECAKVIIQSGIKTIVYISEKKAHCQKPRMIAAKRMFNAAGVGYRQYVPKRQKLEIDFSDINWTDLEMNQLSQTPMEDSAHVLGCVRKHHLSTLVRLGDFVRYARRRDTEMPRKKRRLSSSPWSSPWSSLRTEPPEPHREERHIKHEQWDISKRTSYIDWDEYFMAIAFLSAKRSKDPNTQVGACIVNDDKRIVGIGYNGMPMGCSDDEFPWQRGEHNSLNAKYLYVCHAEINAVLNKNSSDVKNCAIYVALFPCNQCAKVIIQSGIKTVVYMSDKYAQKVETIAAKRMFDAAGVEYRQYVPKSQKIEINFGDVNWTEMNQLPQTPTEQGNYNEN
ncbi:PREDICTED: uncharacterized protein LOC105564928 [Vollenhovia emeryi]|uniref:uncharacterized protein LOC105564928 n=1 Tax=Vollenhovia emeryi TaxID=411798 RepID=UPI0005F41599|nr:PREDICTED: uncharacterized protein LOC105564928 [Vollenhovia emeryi]